jgi:hypothetical protein
VWTERRQRPKFQLHPAMQRVQHKLLVFGHALIARLPWFADRSTASVGYERYVRGQVIVVLVIAVLILIPLEGALYDLHKDSDSVAVSILWRATSVVDSVVRLGLIVLLALAGYRFVTRRGSPRQSSAGEGGVTFSSPTKFSKSQYDQPWDPRAYLDEERPKGWYVDPNDPGKMHHWGGRDSPTWVGTTRTPRKIHRAWQAGQ